jgi:photosystem II stability/assembly factor-like uncharacterized protein
MAASARLLVGTRKGLFTFERAAPGRWRQAGDPAFLGTRISMLLQDGRTGTQFAAHDNGHFGVKLHRSTDGGTTWNEIAAPAFPKQEPPAGDDGEAPSVSLIWSLETGGVDRPGRLWAGTIPGGLFRSDDNGDSWQLVTGLWERPERARWFGGGYDEAGIHSICIDPRDSNHVTVAVSCGGVWDSADGGQSWDVRTEGMWAAYMPPEQRSDSAIQDPHRLVQCPAAPDHCWVQHHNGVFRSTDGARHWSEITERPPSVFGFAVAVHPQDPLTAWFAPAVKDELRVPVDGRLVVSRTRDGGKSFEVLTKGLPPAPGYDLVYRHGMDVAGDGRCLAMASTTGNLWISEDQGDSWQALSLHLPPIACVRFA